MKKIFIDGSAGTTGLRIRQRLEARREALNRADAVFLCLPDEAAREAVSLISEAGVAVIDASTAHRTAEGWCYGFPELRGRREQIAASRRVANPGCHASGFIALVAPLVEEGVLAPDALLSCFSLTGYSGGGKRMIAEYENEPGPLLAAPRQYGLSQSHKHLPEMAKECGLVHPPIFSPIVAPYYAGMEVTVPLHRSQLRGTAEDVRELYPSYYRDGLVRFSDSVDEGGFLSANALEDRDDMELTVWGNADRLILAARFDNLGKGASGAAIQNMNILLGLEEAEGLNLSGPFALR